MQGRILLPAFHQFSLLLLFSSSRPVVPSLAHIVVHLENGPLGQQMASSRGRGPQCPAGRTLARVADSTRPAAPRVWDWPMWGISEPLTGLVTVGQGPILGGFVAQGDVWCSPLPRLSQASEKEAAPRASPRGAVGNCPSAPWQCRGLWPRA